MMSKYKWVQSIQMCTFHSDRSHPIVWGNWGDSYIIENWEVISSTYLPLKPGLEVLFHLLSRIRICIYQKRVRYINYKPDSSGQLGKHQLLKATFSFISSSTSASAATLVATPCLVSNPRICRFRIDRDMIHRNWHHCTLLAYSYNSSPSGAITWMKLSTACFAATVSKKENCANHNGNGSGNSQHLRSIPLGIY